MKLIILNLFAILLSYQVLSQNYTTVKIEKKEVDTDNIIYKPGQQFVFNLTILKGKEVLFLNMDKDRSFNLSDNKTEKTVSRVFMTVAKPKKKDKTNKKQTEIFYGYENLKFLASSTGMVENTENVWLHPPRDGFFSLLELFPFPYIKYEQPINKKWVDKLLISDRWSNDWIGSWEGKLKTEVIYKITENVMLKSDFGEISCQKIHATSTSVMGTNTLIAYFSKKYGFMQLEYISFNNLKLIFELNSVIPVDIFTTLEEFLLKGK